MDQLADIDDETDEEGDRIRSQGVVETPVMKFTTVTSSSTTLGRDELIEQEGLRIIFWTR